MAQSAVGCFSDVDTCGLSCMKPFWRTNPGLLIVEDTSTSTGGTAGDGEQAGHLLGTTAVGHKKARRGSQGQGLEAVSGGTEGWRGGKEGGATGGMAVKVAQKVPAAKSCGILTFQIWELQRIFGEKSSFRKDVQHSIRGQRQSLATQRKYGEGAGARGEILRAL